MSNIDFVLDAFASTHTMDLSATLDSGAPPSAINDVSATAVYYIPTDTLKNVFRFSSNSWDINDVSADDIHYFTFMENWPASLQINPVHAMMNKSDSENPILSGLDAEKMLVKHDFVRYLALSLFKTAAGVDLFNNEVDLLNELKRLGDASFDTDISGMMWAKQAYTTVDEAFDTGNYEGNNTDNTKYFIDVSVNRLCTTDEFTSEQNLPRELFRQVLNVAPARFNDISFVPIDVDNNQVEYTAAIPFEADDTISYRFTVSPATNQHLLTQTSEFGPRVYRIKLILKDDVDALDLNTTPTD
jgi:hypothetical protein